MSELPWGKNQGIRRRGGLICCCIAVGGLELDLMRASTWGLDHISVLEDKEDRVKVNMGQSQGDGGAIRFCKFAPLGES
jgi:hypothetical protein